MLHQVVLSLENPSMLDSVGNLSVIAKWLEDIAYRLKGINAAVSIIDSLIFLKTLFGAIAMCVCAFCS